MKKLVLFTCMCVGLCFASCGNKATNASNQNDSDTITVDSLDSVSSDSVTADSL